MTVAWRADNPAPVEAVPWLLPGRTPSGTTLACASSLRDRWLAEAGDRNHDSG